MTRAPFPANLGSVGYLYVERYRGAGWLPREAASRWCTVSTFDIGAFRLGFVIRTRPCIPVAPVELKTLGLLKHLETDPADVSTAVRSDVAANSRNSVVFCCLPAKALASVRWERSVRKTARALPAPMIPAFERHGCRFWDREQRDALLSTSGRVLAAFGGLKYYDGPWSEPLYCYAETLFRLTNALRGLASWSELRLILVFAREP